MSRRPPLQIEYVTDEYAQKLDDFAAAHEIARDAAEQAFRDHCRELQDSLKDETPAAVVRRIAFHKLEWEPPSGPVADSAETDAQSGSPRVAHE